MVFYETSVCLITAFLLSCDSSFGLKVDFSPLPYKLKLFENTSRFELSKGSRVVLTISLVSIVEKDSSGNDVPANASINPHKELQLYMKKFETNFQAVNASSNAPRGNLLTAGRDIPLLQRNARLSIGTFVALGNGTLDGYGRTDLRKVLPHNVFIFVSVERWPFCASSVYLCPNSANTNIIGKYVDVKLRVEPKDDDGKAVDFSQSGSIYQATTGGVMFSLNMTSKVGIATGQSFTTHNMAPTYGNKMFTIRFPIFNVNQAARFRFGKLTFKADGAHNVAVFGIVIGLAMLSQCISAA